MKIEVLVLVHISIFQAGEDGSDWLAIGALILGLSHIRKKSIANNGTRKNCSVGMNCL
jgi:hypothetical protein